MIKENYQHILDKTLKQIEKGGDRPRLLLHSCCAPCSSYVLEYLTSYFDITIFYYNPNIFPQEEFLFRADEQQKLIENMPLKAPVSFLLGEYDTESFFSLAKGHERELEGGPRCKACYSLRLRKTAEEAKKGGFDYFTTTLSISPHKDAQALNQIGKQLAENYDVPYLFSDFKKRDGYRRSCQLSESFGLYRQNYCGCPYSKLEAELREENSQNEI
ncbi:epoxyqueuosine reductase QueH [Anaerotignum sp. MB30-C6]|uniref:epoxyqueuosine reductase QueH n=1 Tax=Anaerotignum sp. MB30-C6 TaxID=3070814 RepID=UPI0027DE92DD|nr:epoxyqueuosine reductase QueH [Anaerotignum sp. MB30-C6]WMI80685.1 epoxyqueuosine reductase QueH [Anaerotignum sp. MB30-C6]